MEITGLKKTDQIVRLMYTSFEAVRSFIKGDISTTLGANKTDSEDEGATTSYTSENASSFTQRIGLSYQINIVLPETDNVAVFNAIFKSLRDNLLR